MINTARTIGLLLFFAALQTFAAPQTFEQAKAEARQYVYHDRTQAGTFYCGCNWEWVGRSGGRVDLESCGYQIRSQANRAIRTEWEHVVPASNFDRARLCWQNGGRKNCNSVDPVFNAMEADLHNLTPSVGEINANRSNYNFGMLPSTPKQHGACDFKVDFKGRTAEPRDEVKGQIARIYFYMHDRYNMRMSQQQQQLLLAWDKQFPVSEWERDRDRRIAARMGHSNPFVTGERKWSLNHKNTADGIVTPITASHPASSEPKTVMAAAGGTIRGNRNSRVYHLPAGCPSYDAMKPKNIVEFSSEAEARAAGFRKAGNCR
ncbi:endonuclease [Methylotuvimicrobium buryatense]|uniref:endonuclease n=1 Tax=Methylotuvimicrobium buryatense TaxID=95641 RepID=UPI00034AEA91|nr:endonuclease [Methylotuvimicrobium buryatense]